MHTIFSVLRQQRKSDAMTSFGYSARSAIYYQAGYPLPLIYLVSGNNRTVKRGWIVAFAFIVSGIFIFLVYIRISPRPSFARLRPPSFQDFRSRLFKYSNDTRTRNNSIIITTTTTDFKTSNVTSSTVGRTTTYPTTSALMQVTSTTATPPFKSTVLLAKNEPRLLNPADYDQKGVDSKFSRITSKAEIKHYIDLLRKLDELFKKAGLTYFIYSGTLLGSYRHFGFIPWDDDVDVFVPYAERDRTSKVLTVPGYECITAQGSRWKFDFKSDKLIRKSLRWRWPFVDISFYRENSTCLWDSDTANFGRYIYKKDWIFPLTKRPFEGYWFNAPKNTLNCLENNIDLSMCVTATWNHRHEHYISKQHRDKCDKFRPYYAFVNRTRLADGKVMETLTSGSRALQEVVFET
jgi:hypothetical protein